MKLRTIKNFLIYLSQIETDMKIRFHSEPKWKIGRKLRGAVWYPHINRTILRSSFYFGLSILIVFYFLSSKIVAHPHVFIESQVKFNFDKNGFSEIDISWTFDNMFSNMLIQDYDKNTNNIFEPAEIKKIQDEAFANVKNYHYFTYISINNKSFDIKYIKNFSVIQKNGLVTYLFTIPCHVKATENKKEISLVMYDESYFIDIALIENNAVSFNSIQSIKYNYSKDETDNNKNQIPGEKIILIFSKRV
jgi:ABC-type uncharacterized transport system substrate-binding protein